MGVWVCGCVGVSVYTRASGTTIAVGRRAPGHHIVAVPSVCVGSTSFLYYIIYNRCEIARTRISIYIYIISLVHEHRSLCGRVGVGACVCVWELAKSERDEIVIVIVIRLNRGRTRKGMTRSSRLYIIHIIIIILAGWLWRRQTIL